MPKAVMPNHIRFIGVRQNANEHGGRPHINGVLTETILDRFIAGDTLDELAGWYGMPLLDIVTAIRFQACYHTLGCCHRPYHGTF